MRRELQELGLYLQPAFTGWDYVARVNSTGRSLMTVNVLDSGNTIPPIVGETAYIGTAPREWDVAITRVRSYTTGVVGVAENEIEWNTNLWVWCPRTFAPMAKIQRVSDSDGRPTVWMDYDITPVPLPPKVNVSGPLVVEPAVANYYTVSAHAMEQNASIQAGPSVTVFPDGNVEINGWQVIIRFPTSGYKVIVVSATDSNGQTGRRIVPVMCSISPQRDVIIDGLSWQVNNGIRLDVKMPYVLLRPFQPAILQFGLPQSGLRHLLLWQVEPEEEYTPDAWMVGVPFLSAIGMADKLISHSMLLEDGGRDSWYKVPGLNARRAVHLMLEFHSTVNNVANIVYGSSRMELPIHSQQFHEGSLLSQISQLMRDCLSAAYEEFNGSVYVSPEPMLLANRSGVPRYEFTPISRIQETANEPMGRLQAGGFAYQTPYLSRWPGTTPEIWRRTEEVKGLVVTSQDDLNSVSGLLASYRQTNDLTFTIAETPDEMPPLSTIWTSVETGEVQPQRLQIRFADGVDPVTEVTAKKSTEILTGETIVIPSEPAPPPIVYPSPPPIEPPPSYSGWAFVRAQHYIVRTSNIYSTSPIWEIAVWSGNYGNPANPPRIIDFRYIETGGGVSIVANLSNGILIRCDNPTASTPDWYILATPDRYMSMPERPFVISSLVTLPQDPQYIGMFYCYSLTGQYSGHDCFAFTNDGGATWTERIFRSNVLYPGVGWASCETAGTNQITAVGCRTGDYSLGAYRTENKGNSWAYLSDADSITGHLEGVWIARIRKPWQLGASGTLYYVTGVKIYGVQQVPVIAGKSTNNLDTVVETFPSGYTRLGAGLEYWTYDMNEVHVIARVQGQDKWVHAVTFNGGGSWTFTGTFSEQTMFSIVSLRGNPANNKEWTFVVYWTTLPPPPNPPRPIIYQTLDGGYTFTNLTGNWYDLANRGVTHAQDFLILPPFSVKSRRDP